MKEPILQVIRDFLQSHLKGNVPIILGFSGGSDSLALLHLLDKCRRFFPLDLHVAHIDHSWRASSRHEAEELKQMVTEEMQLPFLLHTLVAEERPKANLENYFRQKRLAFFSSLYQKLGAQALILGHHRDDQAETILKRLLEGASFSHLGGLEKTKMMGEMEIWRPMLPISKLEILSYIKKWGLIPIEDETNQDSNYLRARMRLEIFPELEKKFGKSIASNLFNFGQEVQELRTYLDKKVEDRLTHLKWKGSSGVLFLDASVEELELKHLIRKICKSKGAVISYQMLKTLVDLIKQKRVGKKVIATSLTFTVHSKYLHIANKKNIV